MIIRYIKGHIKASNEERVKVKLYSVTTYT